MSLRRVLAIAFLAAASVLASGRAAVAVCTLNTCSASTLITSCCSGNSCSLDGTVTLSGSTCDLDFGARNVTLSGTLIVRSNMVTIEAATFRISGAGFVDARGASGSTGGTVTLTLGGGSAPVFGMAGTASSGIDASGYVLGGGTVHVNADGPVSLTSGGLTANSLDANGNGGTITIDAGSGTMTVGLSVVANAGLGGTGGTIEFSTGGDLNVTDSASVSTTAGEGLGGEIDLHAGGALGISGGATLQANAASGSASDGGEINIDGATIQVNGILSATGGGDSTGDAGGSGGSISLEATTGALAVTKGSQAITVDGAGGGEGGEINMTTDSPMNGTITIAAPLSAQGFGGLSNRAAGGGLLDAAAAAGLTVARSITVNGIGGATGEVDLSAGEDLTIYNQISGIDPVGGGILSVASSHDVVIANVGNTSTLRMTCGGTNNASGPGGEIGILADNNVTITGFTLDVSGSGTGAGGNFGLDAGHDVTIDNKTVVKAISAAQSGAVAGTVRLTAGAPDGTVFGAPQTGLLRIDGQILANGHAPAGTLGPASINLSGCQVTLGSTALVDSTGDADSANTVVGRASITVQSSGKLKATKSNTAIYPSGGPPPATSGATVMPAFALLTKSPCTGPNTPIACLTPCPVCGDGVVKFPEQCDPPGCPGCDLRCRTIVPTGCSDRNACTADRCDNTFGCLNEPLANGTACDDSNACTVGEACQNGVCSGQPRNCDDGLACTDDSCDPKTGCTHTPTQCPPPPNACYQGSVCVEPGGCRPGPLKTCPAGQVCIPATGQCATKPCVSAADCNDGNPCTTDSCPSGACINAPVPNGPTAGCGDSNVCNGVETCLSGVCTPGTAPQIDDGDPCTQDSCDPVLGPQHTLIPGCCVSVTDCPGNNLCTVCADNQCTVLIGCCLSDRDCDDGSVCTTDTCNMSTHQCQHATAHDGTSCGDACNSGTCQSGTCVSTPVSCPPDADVCTEDYCDPFAGCVHPPISGCCTADAQCDDHDACTVDACDPGAHVCSNTPLVLDCSTCSSDTDCDPSGACGQRICDTAAGVCVAHTPPNCTDGNPKTQDSCVVDGPGQAHCAHICLCDDHNVCNGIETCTSTGCAPGTPLQCDDGDACTDDACDPVAGCTHAARTGYPSVACRLDAIAIALQQASGAAITPAVRGKVSKLVGKARTKLAAAQAASGRRAAKSLKMAGASLKAITGAIASARHKNKIDGGLADRITTAAQGAMAAIETLKTSVTP